MCENEGFELKNCKEMYYCWQLTISLINPDGRPLPTDLFYNRALPTVGGALD
jgi:hypothetical protein